MKTEEIYKQQIEELKAQLAEQNNIIKSAISNNAPNATKESNANSESENKVNKSKRVKDILGPVE